MRAPRATWAVSLALLALWVACTVLHVKQVASGRLAWVGVYVTAPSGADGFPTVRGFWPGATGDTSGALAIGDRLLSVGGADLRGVGPVGFVARTYAAAARARDLHVSIAYERPSAAGHTTIGLAGRVPVARAAAHLHPRDHRCAGAGRRPGTRIARSFFLLAIAYGLHWTFFFGGPRWQTELWVVVFLCASLVMLPLILRALLVFPSEVAPAGGRMPWWPWLFALFGPISLSWVFGVPMPPAAGFRAAFSVNVVFIVTALVILTRNYRRAGALGRRQLKWVVLGMYVGTVPVLLADVVAAVVPPLLWLHEVAAMAEIVIPLSVLIAIVRANLFDVDRLITTTAVYSILSVLLIAAALFGVPQLAAAVSKAADLDPHVVQPLLSVGVAASVVPGHRFLQPRIERVLFSERHALRAGVEALLQDLAAADGPDALVTLVGERLDTLVRPQSCLIYAPLGDGFAPVFARAAETPDGPPTLPADGPLVAALRTRTAPLDVRSWTLTRRLPRDERAALEALGAAVLVPVRRGLELAAVICLGAKRSGDVYTHRSDAARRGRGQRCPAAAALRRRRHPASGARDERRPAQLCSRAGGVASDAWAIDRGRRARRLRAVRRHPGLTYSGSRRWGRCSRWSTATPKPYRR